MLETQTDAAKRKCGQVETSSAPSSTGIPIETEIDGPVHSALPRGSPRPPNGLKQSVYVYF